MHYYLFQLPENCIRQNVTKTTPATKTILYRDRNCRHVSMLSSSLFNADAYTLQPAKKHENELKIKYTKRQ